jgi:hypothetical protein
MEQMGAAVSASNATKASRLFNFGVTLGTFEYPIHERDLHRGYAKVNRAGSFAVRQTDESGDCDDRAGDRMMTQWSGSYPE